jgi:MYXO-CTERM domain-containing protein
VGEVTVTEEPLPPSVANGKRLFYRSAEPRHSRDNYIACASCHPDGGMDGRTWDLTQGGEGLRNTIDLRGRGGTGHGPVHWSANFDEIQDFENAIVGDFGGTGLAGDGEPPRPPLDALPNAGRSTDLDDLAAFVASLSDAPPSPYRTPAGELTEPARRGKALFESEELECTGCHVPPRFTDSVLTTDPADYVLYDVGTLRETSGGRLGGPLPGIDTPTLVGIWDTAPYLHDGSAATLREVLVDRNPDDRHGRTSALSEDELDDLAAYLLSIDGRPDDPPRPTADAGVADAGTGGMPDGGPSSPEDAASAPPASGDAGCACSVAAHAPRPLLPLLAAVVLALLARRRRGHAGAESLSPLLPNRCRLSSMRDADETRRASPPRLLGSRRRVRLREDREGWGRGRASAR